MLEMWKTIEEFPDYAVSSLGRVRNRLTGKIIKPCAKDNGYLHVGLYYAPRKKKHRMVQSLVLTAFVGPRPDGHYACHRNGDRSKNYLGNLKWATPTENMQDAIEHDTLVRGEAHPNSKLTLAGVTDILMSKDPIKVMMKKHNVGFHTVQAVRAGDTWRR